MELHYTNELAPELAASLSRPPFSAVKKASMSEGTRQTVEEQEAFLLEHPVAAIYQLQERASITSLHFAAQTWQPLL